MSRHAAVIALAAGVALVLPSLAVPAQAGAAIVHIQGNRLNAEAFEVLRLVNSQRAQAGLGEVAMDADLMEGAMARAAELVLRWGHVRPDGGSWEAAVPGRHQSRNRNLPAVRSRSFLFWRDRSRFRTIEKLITSLHVPTTVFHRPITCLLENKPQLLVGPLVDLRRPPVRVDMLSFRQTNFFSGLLIGFHTKAT
jgi:hypothetical protein